MESLIFLIFIFVILILYFLYTISSYTYVNENKVYNIESNLCSEISENTIYLKSLIDNDKNTNDKMMNICYKLEDFRENYDNYKDKKEINLKIEKLLVNLKKC